MATVVVCLMAVKGFTLDIMCFVLCEDWQEHTFVNGHFSWTELADIRTHARTRTRAHTEESEKQRRMSMGNFDSQQIAMIVQPAWYLSNNFFSFFFSLVLSLSWEISQVLPTRFDSAGTASSIREAATVTNIVSKNGQERLAPICTWMCVRERVWESVSESVCNSPLLQWGGKRQKYNLSLETPLHHRPLVGEHQSWRLTAFSGEDAFSERRFAP